MSPANVKKGKYNIELIALSILLSDDCYGYQITQLIKEYSQELIHVPEGSLYPALYRLVDNGYISDEKRPFGKRMVKTYYHILPAGVQLFKDMYEEYQRTATGMANIMRKINIEEIGE